MATLPTVVYNFNENSATTIRDYSDGGGFDGTGTNLTIQASARVGNEAVFNSSTDQIDMGTTDHLGTAIRMACHLGIKITGSATTKNIIDKASQFEVVYNNATNQIEASLYVNSGTAFVKGNVAVDTYYDIDIVYNSNVLTLYIDGVSTATDATESGAIDANANRMYIGDDASLGGELFILNEFKLYDTSITTTIIDAVIAEQNGILSDNGLDFEPAVGDIIGADLNGTGYYGIVSWVGTGTDFRFLPLTDGMLTGMKIQRVGHLWDTARQWSFEIKDTPEICFYDGVSQTSEVLTAAKKTVCLSRDGLSIASSTKTANYTTVSTDNRIYVDSSGGAFTITLDASPNTNKEIEIIDSVGSCGTNAVTVNGNGKNILGKTTASMNLNYIAYHLVYNGTQWNLK
jgi:hypothetical protein